MRHRGLQVARVVVLAAMLAVGAPAAAQTLFTPPDTVANVGRYSTLEECIAATDRVRAREETRARTHGWNDTLPWNPKEANETLPAPLVATARACSAHLQAASVPVSDFSLIFPLFLVANRDADAHTVLARRLAAAAARGAGKTTAAVDARAEKERVAVLDSAFDMYTHAKPARIETADSLARAFDKTVVRPFRASPSAILMKMYIALAGKAGEIEDTTTMERLAARTISILDSLSPAEAQEVRETEIGDSYNLFSYSAHAARAGFGVLLDSLRRGTAAYVALQQSLWTESTGQRGDASGFPIGKTAPRLTMADAAGTAGAPTSRPVPGKVNLVVFLHASCTDVLPRPMRLHALSDCAPEAASLRRIAARFPAVEITIVERTRGYFMYLPPPSPEEETSLIGKTLEAHHMPGTPVVGATQFFRLAPPDHRRMERKELPNFTQYTFGKSWPTEEGAVFLIDPDGVIVWPSSVLERSSEKLLGELIEVLLARQSAQATLPH